MLNTKNPLTANNVLCGMGGTRVQVELQTTASNSSLITYRQWGIFKAWETIVDSKDSLDDGGGGTQIENLFGFKNIVFGSGNHVVTIVWG